MPNSAPFKAKAPFHARVLGLNHVSFGLDYINTAPASRFGCLSLSNTSSFDSSGIEGGPFTPESVIYTLSNVGGTSISWAVALSVPWLSADVMGGTLASGGSVNVTVTLDADGLAESETAYTGLISWTNTTNDCGNSTNPVNVSVEGASLPALEMTLIDMRDVHLNVSTMALAYETTRPNSILSAHAGTTVPYSGSPAYWNATFMVNDAYAGFNRWLHWNGGPPRLNSSWVQIFSGYPTRPTQAQFAPGVQWSYKLVGPITPPAPPPSGVGPIEIIPSFIQHEVGIGQADVQALNPGGYTFTLRLLNTGGGPLIFGTPTIVVRAGESAGSTWSLNTASIPTLLSGQHFDLVVTANPFASAIPFFPFDRNAMLTLPNNLSGPGSPDIYLDLSLAFNPDD